MFVAEVEDAQKRPNSDDDENDEEAVKSTRRKRTLFKNGGNVFDSDDAGSQEGFYSSTQNDDTNNIETPTSSSLSTVATNRKFLLPLPKQKSGSETSCASADVTRIEETDSDVTSAELQTIPESNSETEMIEADEMASVVKSKPCPKSRKVSSNDSAGNILTSLPL